MFQLVLCGLQGSDFDTFIYFCFELGDRRKRKCVCGKEENTQHHNLVRKQSEIQLDTMHSHCYHPKVDEFPLTSVPEAFY